MLSHRPGTALNARAQAGLSIVEVMVGLMVGILVTLSAWGSVMFYEANRRTSMGGNSALENGLATALTIQRDAKSAGLGFVFAGQSACQTLNAYYNGATTADGARLRPGQRGRWRRRIRSRSRWPTPARSWAARRCKMISGMADAGDLIKVNSTGNLAAGDMILVAPTSPDPALHADAGHAGGHRRLRHRSDARRQHVEPRQPRRGLHQCARLRRQQQRDPHRPADLGDLPDQRAAASRGGGQPHRRGGHAGREHRVPEGAVRREQRRLAADRAVGVRHRRLGAAAGQRPRRGAARRAHRGGGARAAPREAHGRQRAVRRHDRGARRPGPADRRST